MNDFDQQLREALQGRAEQAPFLENLPHPVRRRARRRRAGNVVGIALLSVVVAAGIALPLRSLWPLADQERPAQQPSVTPSPTTDQVRTVTLARGKDLGQPWTLTLTRGPGGDSIDFSSHYTTGTGEVHPYTTGTGEFNFDPQSDRRADRDPWGSVGVGVSRSIDQLQGNFIFGAVPEDVSRIGFDVSRTGFVPGTIISPSQTGMSAPYSVYLIKVVTRGYYNDGVFLRFYGDGSVRPRTVLRGPPGSREAARRDLDWVLSLAHAYAAYHGDSYAGFEVGEAQAMDESLTYNDSAVSRPREISIRSSDTGVVLAARTDSGAVYCIAAELGRDTAFGEVDATSPRACTGGWFDLPPADVNH